MSPEGEQDQKPLWESLPTPLLILETSVTV